METDPLLILGYKILIYLTFGMGSKKKIPSFHELCFIVGRFCFIQNLNFKFFSKDKKKFKKCFVFCLIFKFHNNLIFHLKIECHNVLKGL